MVRHCSCKEGFWKFFVQSTENTQRLSAYVIDYLQTCFSHALTQNKNYSDEINKTLRAIVPHAFEDHSIYLSPGVNIWKTASITAIVHYHVAKIWRERT